MREREREKEPRELGDMGERIRNGAWAPHVSQTIQHNKIIVYLE